MKRLIGSLAVLSLTAFGAMAQEAKQEGAVVVGKQAGVKVDQEQCKALWTKANPTNKPKISAGQAQPFISDVMAANTNKDGAIDQKEFMAACDKGIMKDQANANSGGSANTGAGTGAEGSGAAAPAAPPSPAH